MGPSSQQQQLSEEQTAFYTQGVTEAKTAFSESQDILNLMEGVFKPILARGPNAPGYSAAETSDLNATAIEGTAENYEGAARAVGAQIAAEGGDNPLPTGGSEQLKQEVAVSSARQQSAEEEQIKQASYAEGERQFGEATAALESESRGLDPTAFENAATGAGSSAETTLKDINTESNSWVNAALGAATAIGSAAAPNIVDMNPHGIFS